VAKIADIAWLAGILEGEGSFWADKNRKTINRIRYMNPQIAVEMADKDIIDRVASMLGNSVQSRQRDPSKKRLYNTRVGGRKAVAWMLTLFTLLGQRRRAKIAEIMKEWRLQSIRRK
jgi:hypothetical protein